jgi:hypothetical protein
MSEKGLAAIRDFNMDGSLYTPVGKVVPHPHQEYSLLVKPIRDYSFDIARGKISGHSTVAFQGRHPGVNVATAPAPLAASQTVNAGAASSASLILPSWAPAANDLILVAVALRNETLAVSVSGNGLTFVEVANLDNAQAQCGVHVFRAMGATPTSGSITVTAAGNALPIAASATRFPGADTSGTNGSGAIEAVATNAGPPVTDDNDMKVSLSTLTAGAWAYAAGTHRLGVFSVPAGELALSINNVAGTSGDMTTLSTWREETTTPGLVTVGADNDLDSARDWAVIAVSIKPASVMNIAAAPQVVWTGGLAGDPDSVLLATPRPLQVRSTSALDTAGGTGAQSVKITVLDVNYDSFVLTVPLNGTTPIALGTYFRVNGVAALRPDTPAIRGYNEGEIIVETADAPVVRLAHAAPRAGRAQQAIFTVPRGLTGYLIHYRTSMSRAVEGAAGSLFEFRTWAPGGTWTVRDFTTRHYHGVNDGGDLARIPPALAEKTDAIVLCTMVTNNNTMAFARCHIVLIDMALPDATVGILPMDSCIDLEDGSGSIDIEATGACIELETA